MEICQSDTSRWCAGVDVVICVGNAYNEESVVELAGQRKKISLRIIANFGQKSELDCCATRGLEGTDGKTDEKRNPDLTSRRA